MTSKLSLPTLSLLLTGANVTGTFTEGFYYIEEELSAKSADEAFAFCKWLDRSVGGASHHNIRMLYKAYKTPNDAVLQREVAKLKAIIIRLKSYTL